MTLKDVLRKGDPAAGDPGLSPEEIQAMRRTVLSAVPEPRRRGWLVPLTAAAVLILAAVLALSLWRQPAPEKPAPQLASKGRVEAPSPPQPPSPASPPPSPGEGGTRISKAAFWRKPLASPGPPASTPPSRCWPWASTRWARSSCRAGSRRASACWSRSPASSKARA